MLLKDMPRLKNDYSYICDKLKTYSAALAQYKTITDPTLKDFEGWVKQLAQCKNLMETIDTEIGTPVYTKFVQKLLYINQQVNESYEKFKSAYEKVSPLSPVSPSAVQLKF